MRKNVNFTKFFISTIFTVVLSVVAGLASTYIWFLFHNSNTEDHGSEGVIALFDIKENLIKTFYVDTEDYVRNIKYRIDDLSKVDFLELTKQKLKEEGYTESGINRIFESKRHIYDTLNIVSKQTVLEAVDIVRDVGDRYNILMNDYMLILTVENISNDSKDRQISSIEIPITTIGECTFANNNSHESYRITASDPFTESNANKNVVLEAVNNPRPRRGSSNQCEGYKLIWKDNLTLKKGSLINVFIAVPNKPNEYKKEIYDNLSKDGGVVFLDNTRVNFLPTKSLISEYNKTFNLTVMLVFTGIFFPLTFFFYLLIVKLLKAYVNQKDPDRKKSRVDKCLDNLLENDTLFD